MTFLDVWIQNAMNNLICNLIKILHSLHMFLTSHTSMEFLFALFLYKIINEIRNLSILNNFNKIIHFYHYAENPFTSRA